MDEWTIRDLTAWANRAVTYINASGELNDSDGKLTDHGDMVNRELSVARAYVRWIHGG